MIRISAGIGLLLACVGLLAIAGCSDVPEPPPRFQIDPQQAAQEAMKLYDRNGDGALDAKELTASPPLRELLKHLKEKSPGHPDSLTAEDISGRLEEWVKAPATLCSGMVTVYLDGKRLEAATVTYDPEPFLGPSYHWHQGQTNAAGMAVLDPELQEYPGDIYVGLYRVRISKRVNGKESLPARYNTESELGREVVTQGDSHENVMFRLNSK